MMSDAIPINSAKLDELLARHKADAVRIRELEESLAKYQCCRVHDVDEKNWLRERVTALEAAIREIASYQGDDSSLDINAKYMRDAAREAIGYQSETKGDVSGEV